MRQEPTAASSFSSSSSSSPSFGSGAPAPAGLWLCCVPRAPPARLRMHCSVSQALRLGNKAPSPGPEAASEPPARPPPRTWKPAGLPIEPLRFLYPQTLPGRLNRLGVFETRGFSLPSGRQMRVDTQAGDLFGPDKDISILGQTHLWGKTHLWRETAHI